MKCPRCQGELAQVEHQGVQIDRCPACSGLWFDAFEHEELKALGGSEAIDPGPSAGAVAGTPTALCPKCSVKMIGMVVIGQPHISYESCGLCHGVFFDAGEFRDFREETFGEKLRSYFGVARGSA